MKTATLAALLCFSFTLTMLHADPAKPEAPVKEASPAVTHVKAPEAAKAIESAAKDPAKAIAVLDVRTPEEFAEGHLKGAKNVDFNETDFEKQLGPLDKNKTYLVHCASGGRSTRSLKILEKLGFKSIIHLDGGFKGWKDAGLPVEK